MKSCNICGSLVAKLHKHLDWHTSHGDKNPGWEHKTHGFCTDCGSPIEFGDGKWNHLVDKNCSWKRGTVKAYWLHCNRCGTSLIENRDHSCK